MDADSSYGGSDTAQDSTLGHDNNSLETTIPNHPESAHDHHDSSSHHDEQTSVMPSEDSNTYYKNEITLPVNYEETEPDKSSLPHYLSTAKLTIEESLENHHNLDELSKNYSSTHNLNSETPKSRKKSTSGIDNPAFHEDETKPPTTNGALKSTFDEKKTYNNGDLNSSVSLGFTSPTKHDEPLSEAVNLELINLKPTGKDVVGPYENGNGLSDIPVKKETEVEIGNPYDEYFVPVNEHRKYMSSTRKGRNSVTFAETVASAGVDDTGLSLTTPERGILEYPDWLTALDNPRGEKLYLTKDKRDSEKRNRCLCWSLLLAVVVAAVIVGILAAVGIIGNQEPEPIHEARNFGGSSSPNDIKTGGGFFGISEEGDSATKTPSNYPISPEPPISTVSNLLPTTDTSMIEVPRALESQFKIEDMPFSAELMNPNSTTYRNLAEILENELKSALFTNDVLNFGAANIQLKITEFLPGSVVVKFRIGWEFRDGIHNPKDPIDLEALKTKLQNALIRNNGYLYEYHVREDTINTGKIMNLCQIENNGCEHTCSFDYKLVNFVCSCPPDKLLSLDGKKCINLPEPQAEPEPTTDPDVVDFEFEHVHTTVKPEPSPAVALEPTAIPEPEPNPEPTVLPESEPEATPEPTVLPEPEPEATPEPEPEATPEPHAHPEPEPTVQPEPTPEPEPVTEPTTQSIPQLALQPNNDPTPEPTPEPDAEIKTEPTTKSELKVEPHTTYKLDRESFVHNYMTTSEPTILLGTDRQYIVYGDNIPAAEPTSEPILTTEVLPATHPASNIEHTSEPQPAPEAGRTEWVTKMVSELENTTSPKPQLNTESDHQLLSAPTAETTPETQPAVEAVPRTEPEPQPTTERGPEATTELAAKFLSSTSTSAIEPEPTTKPEININSELTTTWRPSLKSFPPTESNTFDTNETAYKQHKTDEGHILVIQSAEKHTTLAPELTTLSEGYFSNDVPKIQLLTFEDSNVNTTVNSIESETATTSFRIENEASLVEKTTLKSELEQLTGAPVSEHMNSDNPTTTTPKQSTNGKLHENVVLPSKDSPETTTTYLLNLVTTENSEKESDLSTEVSINDSANVALTEISMKPDEQSILLQQQLEYDNMTNTAQLVTGVAVRNETEANETNFDVTTETISKQSNWIPIELNSKNEMIKVQTTTSSINNDASSVNNNQFVPFMINDERHLINMENQTLSANMSPKEYQTTTIYQAAQESTKSSYDIHKNIDTQDHSTENIILHTIPETHQHMVTYDPTESTNMLDNMSPFLPEIENDTLVKILHSDVDHYTDMPFHHNDSNIHDEHIYHIAEKPPRLDNDEMNVTNPYDPNPTDTVLAMSPTEEDKTEKFNEILSSLGATTQKEMAVANNEFSEQQLLDTVNTKKDNIPEKEQTTINVIMETTTRITNDNTNSEIYTTISRNTDYITTSPRNIEPTLNPDILNNVHSNNLFLKLQTSTESADGHTETPQTTSTQPEQNTTSQINTEMIEKTNGNVTTPQANFTDISTSTEDLVALETTTNKLNEETTTNNFSEITKHPQHLATTDTMISNRTASTIYAEILDTVTEIVHFSSDNNNSVETTLQPEMVNATENISTITVPTENNSTELTTTEISKEINKALQYEVHENIEDITTTRSNILKLFTTQSSVKTLIDHENRNQNEADDPLSASNEDIFVKEDQKRDENYNKFDPIDTLYDPNDFLNDISDEEKSVLEKFSDVDRLSSKQKENEKLVPKSTAETKLDFEHEKDHYLATDFTDKATFTATPSKKNYFENSEKELYNNMYFPEKILTETKAEKIDSKNYTTELISEEVKPVTEGFTISGFSRCAAGQFQCRNGTAVKDGSYCIPSNNQCDSTDDCTDASDETGCAQENCRNNFQCTSGQCLKRNLVCDGIANCNDRSDELNCESWKCSFDEFSCGAGGRCIPLSWKCDGNAHCPNAEDEHHCHTETCNNNEYHCMEQGTCIRASLRCDGNPDCTGGDDENLCECAVDQFKCKLGGGCIPIQQQCDGIEQCADFSDEWNCLRLQEFTENGTSNYLEVLSTNKTWIQICSDSWNNSYSDLACQNLGYAGATSTEPSKILENSTISEYYKLKPLQQYGAHLLTQLEKTDSCDSVVSVTCQEFVCGSHSSIDVQSARIIGGSSAADTQWPSVTLLYNKKFNRQCTATLVAPMWVIASYSCILATDTSSVSSSSSEWVLYAGGTNFFNNVDNSTTQIRSVKNIIIHPQEKYSQFVFKYDMVLVELTSPLILRQNVAAICLPKKDIEPRQLCVTAGWGISKPGDSNTQQYLHYLPVPTIDMEECNSTKHYNGRVPDDKICAGYTDSEKTPCYNDEGAPLMCFSDTAGTWELHGLLAYHSNCGRNHHPALYSSINEDSRKWIANTVGLKAITNQRLALSKE